MGHTGPLTGSLYLLDVGIKEYSPIQYTRSWTNPETEYFLLLLFNMTDLFERMIKLEGFDMTENLKHIFK